MSTTKLTRRAVLAAAAVSGAAAARRPAAAEAARMFTVATWGGLYEQILRRDFIPGFAQRNGVDVRLDLGLGSTQLPKLLAARGRAPFSVLYLNDDEAILGAAAGLWAPDQSAALTNIPHIYDTLRPPALPMYDLVVYELPLVYNPKRMAPPASWNALWQPGLTVGIPDISNSYGITFLYIAALLHGGSADDLGPGFAAIRRLPRYKIYNGVTQGFAMFQQGEIDAALYYGHRAYQLQDQGIDVAVAHPAEGVWGLRAGVQIPRTAPDLDLARAWVDMALGVPYQTAYAAELYSPSNRDVVLSAAVAKKQVYGEAAVKALRFPPWERLNPLRDTIIDRWNREIAG